MDIGNNIKKARELRNLSQSFMAAELNVSQKTYSNIENSKNNITVEMITKIANILQISINKIFELNAEAILNNSSQSGGINQLNTAPSYNYSNEKAFELYEKLIIEKDKRIAELSEKLRRH